MSKLRDLRFRKNKLSATEKIDFDQNMLTLFLAINENKTLLEIAKEIKMEKAVFKDCLVRLYKLRLIEEVKEKVEHVSKAFLDSIHETLIYLLGPLGEILIQDAAESVGAELPYLPKERAADFIDAIVREIPGEKQRKSFEREMKKKRNALKVWC